MKRIFNEDGAAAVLVVFGMTVFIGIIALVLDMGSLYLEKNRLQKIVDAAALSGAQELPLSISKSQQEANKTIVLNDEDPNLFQVESSETKIQVTGRKKGQLFFANALGIENPIVEATARVELFSLSSGIGAIPLGVQPTMDLTYGTMQTLKVSDSATGNFGAIALTGPGAKDYETDLTNGYGFEIKVNDILNTQTGQLAGPTKRAVESRLSLCPNSTYMSYPSNCARVVLIPVFEPVQTNQNQIKQVKVVGFASFFLEGVSSTSQGAEVTGRFINAVHNGESDSNLTNYGAYSFKLTQ
jgi:Flp pilus assembly protein TadG